MWRAQLDQQGFVIFRGLLSDAEVRHALAVIESRTGAESPLGTGGTRDVLDRFPELRRLAEHDAIRRIVGEVLGTESFVVRATLFDKTTGSNWKVPWHQDLTIAVNRRRDLPGYGPWSTKVGVTHVQPPTEVLERMISLRLHLDPCSESNGALKVIPGTHKLGRVNQNEISRYLHENRSAVCVAEKGDALVMRPLLLHASSAAAHPSHRRVLHFDYATGDLDGGLEWRMRPCTAVN